MGCEGYVYIWSDKKVRAAFPDCDRLFACLPTHYRDELDGTLYHHCYWDSSWLSHWEDERDWYRKHYGELTPEQVAEDEQHRVLLREFVKWLEANATQWEVWT